MGKVLNQNIEEEPRKLQDSNLQSDKSLTTPQYEAKGIVDQIISNASAQPSEFQVKLDAHRISMKKEYPPIEYLFSTNGVPHMNLSELHLVTAAPKHGKTSFTNILCACAISEDKQWGVMKCNLDFGNRPVIVFDCEENETDTAIHNKQILQMAGYNTSEDHPNLIVFNLRQGMSYEDRRNFIFETIRYYHPVMAILDGLRDLIVDINDPKENPLLLSDIMSLASETRSALVCILHNNPNSDKARGWSGTEGVNRCGYTYNLEKKANVVTVSVPIYRHAPVPDMQFSFDIDGTPISDESVIQQHLKREQDRLKREAEEAKSAKEKEHLDIVMGVLKEHNGEFSRAELVTKIDNLNIEGFRRRTAYDYIRSHLNLPNPYFKELNGKMVIARS